MPSKKPQDIRRDIKCICGNYSVIEGHICPGCGIDEQLQVYTPGDIIALADFLSDAIDGPKALIKVADIINELRLSA